MEKPQSSQRKILCVLENIKEEKSFLVLKSAQRKNFTLRLCGELGCDKRNVFI